MKRAKKTLALLLVPAGLLVLWALGPEPLRTCPYVQRVTATSAVVARIDAGATRLRLRVSIASPHAREEPKTVTEEAATREHALAVTGLSPRTRYRYRLEELDSSGRAVAADEGEFRTADDDDRILVRFAAVGDSGQLPWWICFQDLGWLRARPLFALLGGLGPQYEVAKWISRQELDFFVHLGDVVYPKGEEKHYREAFFLPFEPVLRKTPVYAALGNHDVRAKDGEAFLRIFHLPTNEARGDERFYSFTSGPLRIVVLDTSSNADRDLDPKSAMRSWLEETLSANVEPWVVVAMHHAVFSASVEEGEFPALERELWPVFARHGVDLVITGHAHNYQRFEPIDGVVQVVSGGGGKSLYPLHGDPRLRASAEAYGFLLVEVVGGKLSGEAWGHRGESLDRFELNRAEEIGRGAWALRAGCARCERLGALLHGRAAEGISCRHRGPPRTSEPGSRGSRASGSRG